MSIGYNYSEILLLTAMGDMDVIFIEELRVETRVGIHPREQVAPQTVEISLEIGISAANAGFSDDLRDTVDYAAVIERLTQELSKRQFKLLERLAEFIADLLLKEFACQRVCLSVAKIGVIPKVHRVGVRIERSL